MRIPPEFYQDSMRVPRGLQGLGGSTEVRFYRVSQGFHKGSTRVPQGAQGLHKALQLSTRSGQAPIGARGDRRVPKQLKQHAKQNRRRAMIGGLRFAPRPQVGNRLHCRASIAPSGPDRGHRRSVGCTFVQVKRQLVAWIGGLLPELRSGPSTRKEHRMLLGNSPEHIFPVCGL